MEQEVTMNNEVVEMNEDQAGVGAISNDTIVKGMIFLAGVATPFVVKGVVKLGKMVVEKIKSKRQAKLETVKDDLDDYDQFSEFDTAE